MHPTDMAHDLFISHSTKDKTISDAICAALEGAGIRCWIAPRDVQPGRSFAGEINRAIQQSKVMVLVFSAHSNNSEQVLREVQLAVNAHLHIVQFRLEDVRLNDDLGYFLSTPHWLDAMQPPLENHIHRLKTSIKVLLDAPSGETVTSAAPAEPQTSAPVAPSVVSSPPPPEQRNVRGTQSPMHEGSTPAKVEPTRPSPARTYMLAGAIVALLAAGVLAGWWLGIQQPRKEAERQRQSADQSQKEKESAPQRELAEQERVARETKAKADAAAEKHRLAAQQRAKDEEARKKEESPKTVAAASKEQPYVNSLGMKFVPVTGTGVLFSVWEARVKDYKVFVEATKSGWPKPDFQQSDDHPAVNVSWEDATAFCEWLTEQERTAGRISAKQGYRLPSDEEWSAAVGLEKESGSTPATRNMQVKGVYPWGKKFPPPSGAGNYAGSEARVGSWPSDWKTIDGFRDDYPRTSPAGSFEANGYGIHDLGGNVWEWCEDWWNAEKKYRVLRGASWSGSNPDLLLSSCRTYITPVYCFDRNGFRCVLVVESSR